MNDVVRNDRSMCVWCFCVCGVVCVRERGGGESGGVDIYIETQRGKILPLSHW